jgi:hypothetical protein
MFFYSFLPNSFVFALALTESKIISYVFLMYFPYVFVSKVSIGRLKSSGL